MPSLRLAVSYCVGGVGAVAAGITAIISFADFLQTPTYYCGTSSAVEPVCQQMIAQMSSFQMVYSVGFVLMAAALLLGPQRRRLAVVQLEAFWISALIIVALWVGSGMLSGSL